MMAEQHYVIIGNGPAANEAAEALREKAPESRVSIISKEHVGYYQPHLLPDFIAGKVSLAEICIHPPSFYKEHGIKLRLGQEVVEVNFPGKELLLAHNEVIRFDGLIIATGGKPRIPEPLQVFEDLLMKLKTVADAKAWQDKLAQIDSVLVIGGDLTSLAFTKALLSLDKDVRFIVDEDCFWPLRFTRERCDQVVERLVAKGVKVVECRKLKSVVRISDDLVEVETDAGKLSVGAVGGFFGLTPDVRFLARSGLHIERGILVDEYLRTQFEGAYAAGDCAQVYHPELRDYWVSIGYRNARNLGRIAGLNLAGDRIQADMAAESIFQIEDIKVNTSWWTEF